MRALEQSLASLAVLPCALNAARADEVDDYIKRELRQLHIPGLSLAVVRDGTVIKARGYGLADLGRNVPAPRKRRSTRSAP